MSEEIVILITAPSTDEGAKIARTLVDEHLVACVNIVSGVRSFFFWEGRTQEASETLLICKSRLAVMERIMLRVKELHAYSVPEIIALPIEAGHAPYLRWLAERVYFELPAAERQRFPAFSLADREVRLRVEQEGFQPMRLVGREGSTLAFRIAGRDTVWLLLPFVLDEASSRIALRLAEADPGGWAPAGGAWREWLVATPAAALELADPPVRIVVEGLG